MKNKQYRYLNLTLFAAAFGLLEAVVVVYLRKLFYPAGFVFPLKWIPADIVYVEILREISTMVILFSVARLASRKFYRSLAAFLYMFGIWDIFYYLSLKFLIGWPPSIFTWDILYLIPITWTAPVIAPIICAITMIAGAFLIEKAVFEKENIKIQKIEWGLISVGATMIFITFIYDFTALILRLDLFSELLSLASNHEFKKAVSGFIPGPYKWWLFIMGETAVLTALYLFYRRILIKKK